MLKNRNIMTFREFQEAFTKFPVIPTFEIEKVFPGFDRNALTRWQKKGYLEKIRQGYYRITASPINGDGDLFFIANRIYHPSYISLQSALRWYDFIPEGVFMITSITTKKTNIFQTPVGAFQYSNIKKGLFFGYRLEKVGDYYFKIAEPEKAILDLLYLKPHLSSEDDLFELRLNLFEVGERLDFNKMENYLSLFSSKALEKRATIFKKFLLNHDVTI